MSPARAVDRMDHTAEVVTNSPEEDMSHEKENYWAFMPHVVLGRTCYGQ
jgi:hypothetical protein